MDNTALELTAAILWTLGILVGFFLPLLISGAIALYGFGTEAAKSVDNFLNTDESPGESIKKVAKIQGKGILVVLVGLVIGLVLAVVAIWNAVEAWVAFAS